ncbi:hypothetical protein KP509_29G060800 [Ceratopteris richardii]|nr:hypothetical protein KP509_29G060800 [Ceratopteris richardii]
MGRPDFQPIENGASSMEHPTLGGNRISDQSVKHNPHLRGKGNIPASESVESDRLQHRNDNGAYNYNNNRKWRSAHRDQGRGNFGWQHHGRAYENGNPTASFLHEQRIGPRNMPRPPQHTFRPMTTPFYHVPAFQNGVMCYTPRVPDFVNGAPYFSPMMPAGGVMHGPDPIALRFMILNQVEYYFSVQNLCKDVFLRMHMDDEGFVPVSVIAQFNRIRTLSTIPMVILEALQHSDVIEVQHDKIRRRNDRGKWRLLPDQVHAATQDNGSIRNLPDGVYKKMEQGSDGGSVSSSEEVNSGFAKVPLMTIADAGNASSESNRVSGNVECSTSKEKEIHQQHDVHIKSQLSVLPDADPCTAQCSPFNGCNSEEGLVSSVTSGDSLGSQTLIIDFSQLGMEAVERTVVVSDEESCSRDSRALAESLPSPVNLNQSPASWEVRKGFWLENSPCCVHGNFEQDNTPEESKFILKSGDEDGDGHQDNANDREIKRLISMPHTSLGSFIAVP